MKKLLILPLFILLLSSFNCFSQEKTSAPSTHGNTLNIGAGIGYYGYVGQAFPMVMINYELQLARNFTLAPFVGFYTYSRYHYWGNDNHDYRNYSYRETVIPIGVKGAYYFDDILHAGSRWDFYLGASVGFVYRKTVWEDGYYGDVNVVHQSSPLYLVGHIGTRFHATQKVGIFLDLSSGFSTLGLSFKL